MVVFVDLDKPLVSQVLVNGELQRIEYEALPTIFFSCGKYGHLKELCPLPMSNKGNETGKISGNLELPKSTTEGEGPTFRPWMVVKRKSRQRLKDLRNQREGDTENEFLGSRFAALKGLENLELRKDERDERILVGVSEKLKDNGKIATRISGKSKEGFKNGIVGNLGTQIMIWVMVFFEAGSRPKGDFRKIKEIIGHNKVGGGPGSLTNGAGHKSKFGEIRFKWTLAKWQTKGNRPSKFAAGPSSAGLPSAKKLGEKTVGFLSGPHSQHNVSKLAVADLGVDKKLENSLNGNVLDLGKHSAVVFKKDSNSKKCQVLGIRGDDGVGNVVFILKARDLSDKGGTS
ncbi:hypothetical protein Goarm_018706 [Gossypium armourianum]|uniref:Zinc knuckle CX2CX4HX4C domain-containing protein n=1 Tax=Gossypium armourianum TaxID=34283 RepID=A0A7J9IID7_9ROSI|nr:hypothetical protein [Gossypium armourianum]